MVDDGAECFICDDDADHAHHIVPRRHGGSDDDRNLVDLCERCHEQIEKIYDEGVFERLNVPKGRYPPRHAEEERTIEYDGDTKDIGVFIEPEKCVMCERFGPFRPVSLQPSGDVAHECCRCETIHI